MARQRSHIIKREFRSPQLKYFDVASLASPDKPPLFLQLQVKTRVQKRAKAAISLYRGLFQFSYPDKAGSQNVDGGHLKRAPLRAVRRWRIWAQTSGAGPLGVVLFKLW
jgi:hypothetical protein